MNYRKNYHTTSAEPQPKKSRQTTASRFIATVAKFAQQSDLPNPANDNEKSEAANV